MELLLAAIAIMIYGGNKNLYNKIFTGDKKYTVGIIFIIGNIAGALKVDILGHSKSISRSNFYAILNHILK